MRAHRSRVSRAGPGRARVLGAVLGALTLVPALALAGCGGTDAASEASTTTSSSSPSPSAADSSARSRASGTATPASPSASDGASSVTAEAPTSSVWFLVDTGARAGFRLAREPRDVSADTPVLVARKAVETMIAGPQDPDYATTWDPDTAVLGVSRPRRVIRVNLSEEARQADVGSEAAALMVQQLVHTVTEPLGRNAPVRLLVGGRPAGELWGSVVWDEPVRRADPLDVRLLVQIDTPAEGATMSSPVQVTGEAAAFEANVPWRVLDANGTVVRRGATTTSEGMRFAPYSFSVRLRPGTYTVKVVEDDPSGGEAPGRPMRDTRTVTVQ